MGNARHNRIRIAVALSAAAFAVGGGAAAQAARPASGGGGPAPAPAKPGLPAGWPADVPVPSGTIQGSTGSAGHWTVQLLVRGSAATVKKSAVDFYTARGYRQVADAVLDKGSRRITLVVENRDHSASETFLVIALDDSAASAPSTAGPAVSSLTSPARVRLSRARRDGLTVRFRAPAGTTSAIVRADRVTQAGRRLVGSRSVRVQAGADVVALRSAAIRHRLAAGTYRLTVTLRDAAGRSGRAASVAVRITRG